jgi:hypothetical protein
MTGEISPFVEMTSEISQIKEMTGEISQIKEMTVKKIRFFQKACRPGPGPDDRRDQRELRELIEGSDF